MFEVICILLAIWITSGLFLITAGYLKKLDEFRRSWDK